MFFKKKKFSFTEIPDLTGKIAIVTGSTSGIGKVSALELARKGCTVVLACRSEEKTLKVIDQIKSETGNNNVEFIQLNLLSLQSVKMFSDHFLERFDRLHILLNNAGVMATPFELTEDGIQTQFATNHVAHHYLTMLLLPTIERSAPSRIVTVSSVAHKLVFGGLHLESINDPKKYDKSKAYYHSKACNILFTRELATKVEARGIDNVYVNSVHPGTVRTDLQRYSSALLKLMFRFFVSPEEGALTQLYVTTSPEIETQNLKGKYFVPYGVVQNPGRVARDKDEQAILWEFTESLLKEKIPSYEGAPI